MRALWECTVLIITEPTTNHPFGGTLDASNTWAHFYNANRVQAWNTYNDSGYASFTGGQPNVLTVSFCPENGTTYAQANDGTVVSATAASGAFESARITWPDVAIGQTRTVYLTGWVARVLVFSRALHYRDNANLQSLITTEMASIGL